MGRSRSIDRGSVLAAAERVVARHGAAKLTIDAVAAEAGISKAGVLYDYVTKEALLQAVVERAMANDDLHHVRVGADVPDGPGRAVRIRIAGAADALEDEGPSAALNLVAAMAVDSNLRLPMQRHQTALLGAIASEEGKAGGGLLAYLALEGLKFLEYLDFHRWPAEQRRVILSDIEWLVGATPPSARLRTTDADGPIPLEKED